MSTAAAATQWPFGLPVWLRSTSALLSRPLTPACAPDRRATQPGVVQLAVVAVTQQRQAVDDDGLQAGIAVGDAGLESIVIDGLALLCHRYNGELDDARLVARLSGAHAGVNGLLNKAEVLRNQTGNPKGHCVAAAAVEIYNGGRGGKKLPSWWKTDR